MIGPDVAVFAMEFTAGIDPEGNTRTFYEATAPFTTGAEDTPAHTVFGGRITDPGSWARHAFSDGKTGGATRLEFGEVALTNVDGGLDRFIDYSFESRDFRVRMAVTDENGRLPLYPSGWTSILTATIEAVEATFKQVTLRFRDTLATLDKPACQEIYEGEVGSPVSELEGTANDIAGRRKPWALGIVKNISPVLVNYGKQIYQASAHPIETVDAVYVRGSALTLDLSISTSGTYTDEANMLAVDPVAGHYAYWPEGGFIRIGSTPDGTVTADVTEGATSADRTRAQIIKRLLLAGGVAESQISETHVDAVDADDSAEVGVYITDEMTTRDAADVIAQPGVTFGPDQNGIYTMGRLTSPSGSPVTTLRNYDVLRGAGGSAVDLERRPPRDVDVPAWRVTVLYARNYTVQVSEVAGIVDQARRGFLAEEYRRVVAEDADIKIKWKGAAELEFTTALTNEADAQAEADRLFGIHSVRRDIYDVPLRMSKAAAIAMLDSTRLNIDRFNLGGLGRDLRAIGFSYELSRSFCSVSLWG